MIYVASPYTAHHGTPEQKKRIRHVRYEACLVHVGDLMTQDYGCFSPIVHWHEVAKMFSMPKGAEFYEKVNRHHILTSTKIHILTLPGWRQSEGLTKERELAAEHNIPVRTIDPSPGTIQTHTRLIENARH